MGRNKILRIDLIWRGDIYRIPRRGVWVRNREGSETERLERYRGER
jgi:hypothetical protein